MNENIPVLDFGYLRLIESWGMGEAGEMEAAIIEAARQSTQGAFRGWKSWVCSSCGQVFEEKVAHHYKKTMSQVHMPCYGKLSNDEQLLSFMFKNKHSTPFEFCGMTIEIQAPIVVFREWQRHRTQGYNEMSARYAPLPDINYMPTIDRLFLTQENNIQAQAMKDSLPLNKGNAEGWIDRLKEAYTHCEKVYQRGLQIGIPKEIARLCLPVGRYSRMRATGNLRNWLGFLTLRMHPDAQWEIRQFATTLGTQIIANTFPKTWALFEKSIS